MLKDFYIYKVTHRYTGEFYIGMRTKPKNCKLGENWYLKDNYWGSQTGWKEIKNLNKLEKSKILEKEIVGVYYNTTQKSVAIIESELIKKYFNNPLNKNYHYDYSGGFCVGLKNPSTKRKNIKVSTTSIVFYKDIPYRLNELNKIINKSFLDSIELIKNKEIIPVKDYLNNNYFIHTKKICIFDEVNTVLNWSRDNRLNGSDFLNSSILLKWYLDKENIFYRELTDLEKIESLKKGQTGIKKPKLSEYMKINNPSKKQSVKNKISEKNKKPKNKKFCPHCEKLVSSSRYHFDNCKYKNGNENLNRKVGPYSKKRETINCPNCGKLCVGKNKWHFENCRIIKS